MDTNNYNKLKPLTLAIRKHLNSQTRQWWTLGLKQSRVPHYTEIKQILDNLSSSNPESTATFKYVANLLYNYKVFKKTKYIRQSLLEYIDNYIIKNNFEREDIAMYLNLHTPRYYKPWWTAWQINVPALIAHEESILQKFRNYKNNTKLNTTLAKQSDSLTDNKILKIADDINNLSKTIYTELPKIDQKIKLEIRRISDDLRGLSNLIDMLDSEVPFNVKAIKKEIADILYSLNNVVKESSNILENKLACSISHQDNTSNQQKTTSSEYIAESNTNIESNNKENTKSKTKVDLLNSIDNETKKSELNNKKINTKPTINNPIKKTIIADDITWLNEAREQATKRPSRQQAVKSYVNKELTEQLQRTKLIKTRRNNKTNNDYLNTIISENNIIKNKNINFNSKLDAQIRPKHEVNINKKQNDNHDVENAQYNTHSFFESLEQYNNSKNDNSCIKNSANYTINFSDPSSSHNTIEIVLYPDDRTLKINELVFDISTTQGLTELNNYLDSSGETIQYIGMSDIVTKFMYDTPLNLDQLEQYGLRLN